MNKKDNFSLNKKVSELRQSEIINLFQKSNRYIYFQLLLQISSEISQSEF